MSFQDLGLMVVSDDIYYYYLLIFKKMHALYTYSQKNKKYRYMEGENERDSRTIIM